LVAAVMQAAAGDTRIVGLVDYGSDGGRSLDEWSDIDVAVFVHDGYFGAFMAERPHWPAQFGDVVYRRGGETSGHPFNRAVYGTATIPLRVDAVFYRESEAGRAFRWPEIPTAVAVVVWFDRTGGRLTSHMRALAEQSLRPADPAAAFRLASDDLWYYLLDACCKLERGDQWGTRLLYHMTVVPPLIRLLRLEADQIDRWYGAPAAKGIDDALSSERRDQLHASIPDSDLQSMRAVLQRVTALASVVSATLASRYGVTWPDVLAGLIASLLVNA